MARMGSYDSTLQMFVQNSAPINMRKLRFQRWLVEQGRAEHEAAGPSYGPLVGAEGADKVPEVSTASAILRNSEGATKFTADLAGKLVDGVQIGGYPEGGQSIRFRR